MDYLYNFVKAYTLHCRRMEDWASPYANVSADSLESQDIYFGVHYMSSEPVAEKPYRHSSGEVQSATVQIADQC